MDRLHYSGTPVPWQRVNPVFRGGRQIMFDTPRNKEQKQEIAFLARAAHIPYYPLPRGILLVAEFNLPFQKSKSDLIPTGARSGDVDNYVKLVMDALGPKSQRIGSGKVLIPGILMENDSQIVAEVIIKRYVPEKQVGTRLAFAEVRRDAKLESCEDGKVVIGYE